MFRELKVLVYAVRLLKDHDLGKLLKIQCWRAWSLRWEIFFMTFSVFNLNCNVFLTLSPPNCDAWCKLQSQVLKSCSLYVYPFRYLGSKRLHYTFFLDCEKKHLSRQQIWPLLTPFVWTTLCLLPDNSFSSYSMSRMLLFPSFLPHQIPMRLVSSFSMT